MDMTVKFVSWKASMSMIERWKKSMVVEQENMKMNIKSPENTGYNNDMYIVMGNSKVIAYLQDTVDKINANKEEKDQKVLPLIKNWTVSEFIQGHYKDIEGNNIFQYCYDPKAGTKEFLM
jgi:transcription termination factor NusB